MLQSGWLSLCNLCPPLLAKGCLSYCTGGVSDEEDEDGETSREDIKKDLLLGHLLALAAQEGGAPPHALPALAASLAATGLLPRWVQVRRAASSPHATCFSCAPYDIWGRCQPGHASGLAVPPMHASLQAWWA